MSRQRSRSTLHSPAAHSLLIKPRVSLLEDFSGDKQLVGFEYHPRKIGELHEAYLHTSPVAWTVFTSVQYELPGVRCEISFAQYGSGLRSQKL